jgi:hypothetical protein
MHNRMLWGLLFVAVGVTAFLSELGLIPGNLLELWPVLLVVIGLWLALSAIGTPAGRGFTGGLVLTAIGGYLLADHLGAITEGLFLPILLVAFGLGLLLRPLASSTPS